uniref:DUF4629 domain-containing protein n=1 Tax=Rhabditophanes sp. KR3021 TaxID=114890 RepID=A0AC35UB59_9BILA
MARPDTPPPIMSQTSPQPQNNLIQLFNQINHPVHPNILTQIAPNQVILPQQNTGPISFVHHQPTPIAISHAALTHQLNHLLTHPLTQSHEQYQQYLTNIFLHNDILNHPQQPVVPLIPSTINPDNIPPLPETTTSISMATQRSGLLTPPSAIDRKALREQLQVKRVVLDTSLQQTTHQTTPKVVFTAGDEVRHIHNITNTTNVLSTTAIHNNPTINLGDLLKTSKMGEEDKEAFLKNLHLMIQNEIEKREQRKVLEGEGVESSQGRKGRVLDSKVLSVRGSDEVARSPLTSIEESLEEATTQESNQSPPKAQGIRTTPQDEGRERSTPSIKETSTISSTKLDTSHSESEEKKLRSNELLENLDEVTKAIEQFLVKDEQMPYAKPPEMPKDKMINTVEKKIPLNGEELGVGEKKELHRIRIEKKINYREKEQEEFDDFIKSKLSETNPLHDLPKTDEKVIETSNAKALAIESDFLSNESAEDTTTPTPPTTTTKMSTTTTISPPLPFNESNAFNNFFLRRRTPIRYNTKFEQLAQDYQERLSGQGNFEDIFKALKNAKIGFYNSEIKH